jgi:hypothetical protein
MFSSSKHRSADNSFARPGRKQATATEDFDPIYYHNWRNIYIYIYIYIYKTRLATNEMLSPSNKIHREVGRAKDLSAPLYSIFPHYLKTCKIFGGKIRKKLLNLKCVLRFSLQPSSETFLILRRDTIKKRRVILNFFSKDFRKILNYQI